MFFELFPSCAGVGGAVNAAAGPPLESDQGVRRASHSEANRMWGFCGSNVTSIAPVFSSL